MMLLVLQLGLIVTAAAVSIMPLLRRRARPESDREAQESDRGPWYTSCPVDPGMLEVSFATAAIAVALPAFIADASDASSWLVLAFYADLLLASFLAALASLWLYQIYVQQRSGSLGSFVNNEARWPTEHVSWVRGSGPYAVLGLAIVLVLVGFALMTAVLTTR